MPKQFAKKNAQAAEYASRCALIYVLRLRNKKILFFEIEDFEGVMIK